MNLAERARRIAAVDPLPFFTRIILDYEVHDFLRGITRWQIFKLLFQPQKCFLITSVAKCLLEDLEHRGMPMECKWARVLVGAFPLLSSRRCKIRPEAENDSWMVRWIILRDLEAIRNIYLVTLRCGQKEQEIQQYLRVGIPAPSELCKGLDTQAATALWLSNRMRRNCTEFKEDWDKVSGIGNNENGSKS